MPVRSLVEYFNDSVQLFQGSGSGAGFFLEAGRVRARLGDTVFGTAFQPLVDRGSGRVVGHEALLRVLAGPRVGVPAHAIYLEVSDDAALVRLDRQVRTLHALNFLLEQEQEGGFLAVNVHPQLLRSVRRDHGLAFEAILARCGLSPRRIVLEISDDGFEAFRPLADAVHAYRQRGYRIAVDNFGRHTASLERLEGLAPDLVKLDRSLVGHAGHMGLARRVMTEMAAELRRLGARVVCQCIETMPQAELARDAGVELLQGYMIGRPAEHCLPVTVDRG